MVSLEATSANIPEEVVAQLTVCALLPSGACRQKGPLTGLPLGPQGPRSSGLSGAPGGPGGACSRGLCNARC